MTGEVQFDEENIAKLAEMMKADGKDEFKQILGDTSNIPQLLDLAIKAPTTDPDSPDAEKQKEVAGFLFGRYIDLVIEHGNPTSEKQANSADTTPFNFTQIAGDILGYFSHESLGLKEVLDEGQLAGILDLADKNQTVSKSNDPQLTDQNTVIDKLKSEVNKILTGKNVMELLVEVKKIMEEIEKNPSAANEDVKRINTLLKEIKTPDSDKILELMEHFGELMKQPEFKDKLTGVLQKIGEIFDIGTIKASDETAQERAQPRSDRVTDENSNQNPSQTKATDKNALNNSPNQQSETDTEKEARLKEEERKRLANQGSTTSNHHNYNSSEMDPTKFAAISLKIAGALAIALTCGPAGFFLAALFLIATKNIANGKEVNYVSPPSHVQNSKSSDKEMIERLLQSTQGQATPNTHVKAGEINNGLANDVKEELKQQGTTLVDQKNKLEATDAQQLETKNKSPRVVNPQGQGNSNQASTSPGHDTGR